MERYAIKNLFGIGGLNIAWYGVIICTGVLLGLILAVYRTKRYHLKSEIVYDFVLLVLPISIVCARVYYVIFEWEKYIDNPLKIFALWEGGLAIYGGVLGGLAVAVLFCHWNKLPLFRFLDLVTPSLVLGQAIGRWGNFVNQEAYGNLVQDPALQFFPYAVFIEEIGEWHQATFFYESLWNICLLLLMLLLQKYFRHDGGIVASYFLGYGTGRFIIEGLRADSLYIFAGVRVSQAVSLFLIFVGVCLMIYSQTRKAAPLNYTGKYAR